MRKYNDRNPRRNLILPARDNYIIYRLDDESSENRPRKNSILDLKLDFTLNCKLDFTLKGKFDP